MAINVHLAWGISCSSLSQFDQLITLDHFNSPVPVRTLNPLKVAELQYAWSHFDCRLYTEVYVAPPFPIAHERSMNMYAPGINDVISHHLEARVGKKKRRIGRKEESERMGLWGKGTGCHVGFIVRDLYQMRHEEWLEPSCSNMATTCSYSRAVCKELIPSFGVIATKIPELAASHSFLLP